MKPHAGRKGPGRAGPPSRNAVALGVGLAGNAFLIELQLALHDEEELRCLSRRLAGIGDAKVARTGRGALAYRDGQA